MVCQPEGSTWRLIRHTAITYQVDIQELLSRTRALDDLGFQVCERFAKQLAVIAKVPRLSSLGMKSTALVFLLLLFGGMQSAQRPQKPAAETNMPPTIAKFESSAPAVYTGGGAVSSPFGPFCVPKARQTVTLTVTVKDRENDPITYEYSVTGGRIVGTGSSVSWRLGDESPGRYSATVKVKEDKRSEASSTLQVVVADCSSSEIDEPPCPSPEIEISSQYTGPKETFRGELLTFHAIAGMDWFISRPDYKWTVTGGKILKGHNTPWITVEANGEVGSSVSATVEFEGVEPYCQKTGKSASVPIKN